MQVHEHPLPSPLPPQIRHAVEPRLALVTCSVCLSVLRGSTWVDAEEAIRELHTFDRPAPAVLQPGLCDSCSETLAERRSA
jgi:hypothetical protein